MEKIVNETEYNTVMVKIDILMAKGSDGISKEELAEIHSLALAAQAYELVKYKADMF